MKKRTITLNNSQAKVDKESVEEALGVVSTDLNSILLLADRFQPQKGKPLYTNIDQISRAAIKITDAIMLVE
jgi:hypothetical protein